MKSLLLSISLALCAAFAATAGTNIYSCGSLNYADYYELQNSLTTPHGNACLTVSGVSGTLSQKVWVNCNGFTIEEDSYNGDGPSQPLISVSSNDVTVEFYNCYLSYPNKTAGQHAVVASGTNILVHNNVVTEGSIEISNCGSGKSLSVYSNTMNNGGIMSDNCSAPNIYSNTIGNYTSAGSALAYGILLNASTVFYIYNNTITGRSTTLYDGIDDGIIVQGSYSDSSTSPTITNRYGGYIGYNSVSQVYDACIEFTGAWSYVEIDSNDCAHTKTAGIGHYHNTSADNWYVHDNHLADSSSESAAPFLISAANVSGSFFTNSTFYNNTFTNGSSSAVVSELGNTGSYQFGSYSGINVTANDFGYAAEFQSSGSGIVTDGGSNTCTISTPSGVITCH